MTKSANAAAALQQQQQQLALTASRCPLKQRLDGLCDGRAEDDTPIVHRARNYDPQTVVRRRNICSPRLKMVTYKNQQVCFRLFYGFCSQSCPSYPAKDWPTKKLSSSKMPIDLRASVHARQLNIRSICCR
jgi:hypothetical protein